MIARTLLFSVILGSLALGASPRHSVAAAVPFAHSRPYVVVSPTSAHIGARIYVTGRGFGPHADVVVAALEMGAGGDLVWQESGYAGITRTDAHGVFHLSFVLTTRYAPRHVTIPLIVDAHYGYDRLATSYGTVGQGALLMVTPA